VSFRRFARLVLARLLVWLVSAGVLASPSPAQQTPSAPADSLRLGMLHREAQRADPRQRQLELHAVQAELRLRNLAAERLPSFAAEGSAQYQSDVVAVPVRLPNGQPVVSPEHNTYDVRLGVQQPILDPANAPRRAVERAQLAEAEARVRTSLFALRQEVNEAFFAAALLQERGAAITAAIADLQRRLAEAAARVHEGAALPSDTAALRAALLQRRQDELEVHADRGAALARLAALRGRPVAPDDVLMLPDLAGAVAQARAGLPALRARPEYAQFARSRERLRQQESVVSAALRPRISAFGRAGYGRPGLNLLGDEFDAYWVAGLQVQWAPWNWGRTRREREVLALQREIVAADEAAFTETLVRGVQQDLAALDRLDGTLALDQEIIALREQIERETRLRFDEAVVTAADYVDRSTDVLEARLALAAHRVEQARARARFLTTLGLEIP
jgi:outer membrane protein TolC